MHEEEEEEEEESSEWDSDESCSSTSASSEGDDIAEGPGGEEHPRPLEGQSLRDYFASTMDYWQSRVDASRDPKALRGEAFQLARAHFTACSLAGMQISDSD